MAYLLDTNICIYYFKGLSLIDFAAYVYDKGKLSLGQARKLAQLDLISFQQELKARNIYLKYDSEELHIDLQNLGLER